MKGLKLPISCCVVRGEFHNELSSYCKSFHNWSLWIFRRQYLLQLKRTCTN